MKSQKINLWRVLAKSLGEKSGKDNREADIIAVIRLLMFLSVLITNCFIVYGVLRTHHFPTTVSPHSTHSR
jgi:hypothetical protein